MRSISSRELFLGDILLGDNALFQLYKLQPFLSELFLVCLAALFLTLCTFLILTCFLFKLFASFLCVYLTDSLHKGLGLLLFAACFFVFGFCAVQLIFFFFVSILSPCKFYKRLYKFYKKGTANTLSPYVLLFYYKPLQEMCQG